MRIGIYGEMFVEWGGGIDFLRILLRGLNALPNSGNVDFKGYKGINFADPVNPQDAATNTDSRLLENKRTDPLMHK